ncbi:MAG: hypothetical protein LBF36_00050 [Mycoplasmataceae bacterium]|nr:hypothetical protein [Mycoplasmataceae bacterium]
MSIKFAQHHNTKWKWLLLVLLFLSIVGSIAMMVSGIKGVLINKNDNTVLWVVGLILLIVSLVFFIKTLKRLIRFIKASTIGETILGGKNG